MVPGARGAANGGALSPWPLACLPGGEGGRIQYRAAVREAVADTEAGEEWALAEAQCSRRQGGGLDYQQCAAVSQGTGAVTSRITQ